jgi:hypothetical protein
MNWYKKAQQGDYKTIGSKCWFEYHCYEGKDSADAHLWYRSHQPITIVSLIEKGYGKTQQERGDNGHPAMYKIRFQDGFEGGVFEDEIMDSKKEFYRPDPPRKTK